MTHKWHQALDERLPVRVVFVDYAKAFDHVDHPTVIQKLTELGVPLLLLRWLHSFLMDRQHRVKIGEVTSEWASPNGGMPQGTWLGVYVFISLINSLQSSLELHKFIDDCTLSEVVSSSASMMQQEIDALSKWSVDNKMNINTKKTKEMLLGSFQCRQLPSLKLNGQDIEQVTSYKLLGLHVTNKLKWNEHVSAICTKASKRLHFLKLLKRAGTPKDDLMHYYESVVRPVTEYACVVWHSSLTKGQSEQLESIQRRAVKIVHSNNQTDVAAALSQLPTMTERRDQLSRKFFAALLKPTSCIHELLPQKRDDDVTTRLRNAKQYSPPTARTERFKKSAVVYSLENYQ